MNVWEISVPPSQFLLKPKTASKEKKTGIKVKRENSKNSTPKSEFYYIIFEYKKFF